MRFPHFWTTAALLLGFYLHLWASDWEPAATTALVWISANIVLSWAAVLWLSKNGGNGASIPGEVWPKDFKIQPDGQVLVDSRRVIGCLEVKKGHRMTLACLVSVTLNIVSLLINTFDVAVYAAIVSVDVVVAGVTGFFAFLLPHDQVYILISQESSAVVVVSRDQKALDLLQEMAKQTRSMVGDV